MNSRQLLKLGVPQDCLKDAIQAIQNLTASAHVKGKVIKQRIAAVLEAPETFTEDEQLGAFAQAIIEDRQFVPARADLLSHLGKRRDRRAVTRPDAAGLRACRSPSVPL